MRKQSRHIPPADITIDRIGDLTGCHLADFLPARASV